MALAELQRVFSKGALPAVLVMGALASGSWLIVGAASRFSTLVDERSQAVVEKFAAKPLAEHQEFRQHLDRNDKDIASLVEAARQQDRNITRLMTIIEEQQRVAARAIPTR